jgi:hypothetical protein
LVVWLHSQLEGKVEQGNVQIYVIQLILSIWPAWGIVI